jgi:two-component system LytT family response regulator
MINCIIVDDYIDSAQIINNHLTHFPEIKLLKIFTDSIEALNFLDANKVDLVFLDIDMPNLNGLEFIESLRSKSGKNIPKFMYTTGYPKYALSGFDLGAADFLVKPIGFVRFKQGIERLIDNWKDTTPNNTTEKEYFFIELDGAKFKVNYKNVMYVESKRNCIHIYENKIERKIYKPMHYIENILCNHNDFIRVHKSFIVSVNYVNNIKGNDIIMDINGKIKTISIGRTYKENVSKKFKI